jgi:hypothetical protein
MIYETHKTVSFQSIEFKEKEKEVERIFKEILLNLKFSVCHPNSNNNNE